MVYNGQGRSRLELNKDKHIGAKLSYPFQFRNGRLLEAGVLGYHGVFSVQEPASRRAPVRRGVSAP